MAEIPYSQPAAPQIQDQEAAPTVNPAAFSIVDSAAGNVVGSLGQRLQQMQDAQDVTKGSLDMEAHLNDVQKSILQSNNYKGYGEVFDSAVAGLVDGINSNYTGAVKTELLNRLGAQKINRGQQLDTWAYDQTISAGKQTMADAATQTLKNVAYGTPLERDMYKSMFLKDVDNHTGTLYSQAEATELKRSFSQQADYGSAITDVENNPAMAAKALKDTKQYAAITPEQRAQLQSEADRRMREGKAMSEAGLKGQLDDALARAAVTGQVDPTLSAKVAATGDKDLIRDWHDNVNMTQLYHDTAIKMLSANPADLPDMVRSFSPGGIDQFTGKPVTGKLDNRLNVIKSFGVQQKLFNQLQSLATQIQTQANTDAPSLSWDEASKGLDPNRQGGQIIDRSNGLLSARGIQSRDPLPQNVATSLAANLSRAGAAERPALLQLMETNYGPHFDDVMRQISAKVPPSTAFYNSVEPDTMKSLIANDAMPLDKMKETVGTDNFKDIDTDARKQFESVAQTLPGNVQQSSALFETFEKLAISNKLSGVSDPVGSAYKSLFTDSYAFDGTWRFPKGADARQIKGYAMQKLGTTTGFATTDGEPDDVARARFQAANNWVYHDGPTQNGKATAGMYYLRDESGQQVYTLDGKPISFSIASAMLSPNLPLGTEATPGQEAIAQRAH